MNVRQALEDLIRICDLIDARLNIARAEAPIEPEPGNIGYQNKTNHDPLKHALLVARAAIEAEERAAIKALDAQAPAEEREAHTRVPWKRTPDDPLEIVGGSEHLPQCIHVAITETSPDAEFIVRACNSHDELLGALKETSIFLSGVCAGPQTNAVLVRAETAIDKAEGKS